MARGTPEPPRGQRGRKRKPGPPLARRAQAGRRPGKARGHWGHVCFAASTFVDCARHIVLGTHSPYVYVPSVSLAGLAGWLACNGGEAGDGVLELMFIRSQQMAVCCAYID